MNLFFFICKHRHVFEPLKVRQRRKVIQPHGAQLVCMFPPAFDELFVLQDNHVGASRKVCDYVRPRYNGLIRMLLYVEF